MSYCRVDDYLVFLDVRRDRYFRLPSPLEQAFVAQSNGWECARADLNRLVEIGILTDAMSLQNRLANPHFTIPQRSAVEQSRRAEKPRATSLLDALALTLATRWQLKTRALKDVLTALVSYRECRTEQADVESNNLAREQLVEASAMFRRARLYVPVDTSCLLDSIALVKFLARRGLYASIVFGVACDPFSAHCWVQAGTFVLNDTVGNAKAFTPIRMV